MIRGIFFTSLVTWFVGALIPGGLLAHFLMLISGFTTAISGAVWLFQSILSPQLPPAQKLQFNFDASRPQELVDYIDAVACSCMMATNNEWLKNNWHTMNDDQKTKWVSERFTYLADVLKETPDSTPHILNSFQMADKNYSRSEKKIA